MRSALKYFFLYFMSLPFLSSHLGVIIRARENLFISYAKYFILFYFLMGCRAPQIDLTAQQFSTTKQQLNQQQLLLQQQQQQLQQLLEQGPEDFLDEPARTVVEVKLLDGDIPTVFLAVSANFGPEVDSKFGIKILPKYPV